MSPFDRSLPAALLACCACGTPPAAAPEFCGDAVPPEPVHAFELEVGGLARRAIVHVPTSYDGKTPLPVVIAFSFFGGSPDQLVGYSDLDEASEAKGALLVVPEGIDDSWNAGRCCGEAWERGIDDVAFTAALLDEVAARYCIREDRVIVTGMSNGALMAHRVGCELADRIHGIAPVAGPLHVASCAPARPISVVQIHGTADDQMPYEGGPGAPPVPVPGDLEFSSIAASMERWREALACDPTTTVSHTAGSARCEIFSGCAAGVRLELCTIEGGGHTWPGGTFPDFLGPTSDDLAAGAYLLDALLPR